MTRILTCYYLQIMTRGVIVNDLLYLDMDIWQIYIYSGMSVCAL
jgi:hypothetical protein